MFGGDSGIYGGSPSAGDTVTGNKLELRTYGVNIYGINNFQKYSFWIPKDMPDGNAMITATNGAGVGGAAINFARTGDNDIEIYTEKDLKVGESIVLINSGRGFQNLNVNGLYILKRGVTLLYPSTLTIDNVEGTAQALVVRVGEVKVNPQSKALSEGRIASLTFIGQGTELLADRGMSEAVSSARDGVSPFVVATIGNSRYKTGSHVDIRGVSLVAGAAKGFEIEVGKVTAGAFIEHGDGKYDSVNKVEKAEVSGNGNVQYTGAGLIGSIDFRNDVYAEVTVKGGSCKNDFSSKEMRFEEETAGYEYEAMYVGGHVGGGYNHKLNEKLGIDVSVKYIFTHYGGKEVEVTSVDRIKFEGTSSNKVRLGVKVKYNAEIRFRPYVGVGVEQELGGAARAKVANLEVEAPSIKGTSVAGEVGVQGNIGRITLDISGSGYGGVRSGADGMFRVKYAI